MQAVMLLLYTSRSFCLACMHVLLSCPPSDDFFPCVSYLFFYSISYNGIFIFLPKQHMLCAETFTQKSVETTAAAWLI